MPPKPRVKRYDVPPEYHMALQIAEDRARSFLSHGVATNRPVVDVVRDAYLQGWADADATFEGRRRVFLDFMEEGGMSDIRIVYVTKRCTVCGIRALVCKISDDGKTAREVEVGILAITYTLGEDAFLSRAEALEDARERRDAMVRNHAMQIERLQRLDFEETPHAGAP